MSHAMSKRKLAQKLNFSKKTLSGSIGCLTRLRDEINFYTVLTHKQPPVELEAKVSYAYKILTKALEEWDEYSKTVREANKELLEQMEKLENHEGRDNSCSK